MYALYSNHYIVELLVLFAKSFAMQKSFRATDRAVGRGEGNTGLGWV